MAGRPFLLSLAATALGATPAQWRSQSIYFLLTDRFARTDNSTSAECDTTVGQYCSGTWRGIINQLDPIQEMGFTAIWITPVTAQIEDHTSYGQAYHGYWQRDIFALNSSYGTDDDLKALADALHDRGMYLMVDVVANHMGYSGPFSSQKYFHSPCFVQNYEDQTQVEQCWLGDNSVSLPDLDTNRANTRDYWYDWIGSLVSNYSIDGLRIDTVKHVQKDFWDGFNDAAGVYCFNEIFDGDPAHTCPYQEHLDGVLNYPIYYPLLNAFKSTSSSISDLYNMIETVKYTCADSTLLSNFIKNHDNPRFASQPGVQTTCPSPKNVAAFLILSDGIPIIYAGQEQHCSGGNDPSNREATWLSRYSTESELYKLIAASNAICTHAIGQDEGCLTYMNRPIYHDDSTIAMRKGYDGTQVITALTNAANGGSSYTLSVPNTGFKANHELTEIYSCTSVTVDSAGSVPVHMDSGLPHVLYPAAGLNGSEIYQ
ncbi:family 13 alpha amylase in complex with acarbose [Aspergillus pseudoustus]|uniref:alpha-amylase n=1 Tax=Aspergillus pseudoustus TaxID=1810923 RepID=A0ABR4ILG6_9EURO